MNKSCFLLFLLLFTGVILSAQETAENYFDRLSENYGTVKDYQGEIIITRGDVVQTANIFYKSPNLLRLDFTDEDSEGIVLNTDGETLLLHLPEHSVTFTQTLARHSSSTIASMAGSQGLHLLKDNYRIGYKTGPGLEALEEGSEEMVVKLRLEWLSSSEGFRELEIAVGENQLIRRITATSTKYEIIQFDFLNLLVNEDIPNTRFYYESPPVGNDIQNFLFEPEE
ncbi:MAG: outer membrane lipoprotein carrier protein LolA [Spirochaetales bacterium]|nr:outer membrane lipoprotein carrier protein LolA [Spirochaetales bacterium]